MGMYWGEEIIAGPDVDGNASPVPEPDPELDGEPLDTEDLEVTSREIEVPLRFDFREIKLANARPRAGTLGGGLAFSRCSSRLTIPVVSDALLPSDRPTDDKSGSSSSSSSPRNHNACMKDESSARKADKNINSQKSSEKTNRSEKAHKHAAKDSSTPKDASSQKERKKKDREEKKKDKEKA